MGAYFQVSVAGPLDGTALRMLRDLDLTVVVDCGFVVVSGDMDQPTLHGLLERIRVLGLQLEEVRRVRRLVPAG